MFIYICCMIVCTNAKSLEAYLSPFRHQQKNIGFVPTMGALHQGHISLIEASIQKNQITVCSIFVNPLQFNDVTDFEKYPITIEQDKTLLQAANCDVLFLPSVPEMYPSGLKESTKTYDLGFLDELWEGAFRPNHFNGVCAVVELLLNMVQPTNLYLGQKDYQQCMVIKRLVELVKKENEISIHICPTLRENNGLAMSSRNKRLSAEMQQKASAIYKNFNFIKEALLKGVLVDEIISKSKQNLINAGFDKIDYLSICHPTSLEPITNFNKNIHQQLVVLVAAFLHGVRLIDNETLHF